jgi:hypothetical protein
MADPSERTGGVDPHADVRVLQGCPQCWAGFGCRQIAQGFASAAADEWLRALEWFQQYGNRRLPRVDETT